MLELFALMSSVENFKARTTSSGKTIGKSTSTNIYSKQKKAKSKSKKSEEGFENEEEEDDEEEESKPLMKSEKYPLGWMIVTFLIAFGTAYLAYTCNDKETPATRCLVTLFAFFFSGIYLIYYFIIYIFLNKKCNGRDVSDLMKRFK